MAQDTHAGEARPGTIGEHLASSSSCWRQKAAGAMPMEHGQLHVQLQPPFFTAFSLRLGKFVQSQRARDVEHVGGNESIR